MFLKDHRSDSKDHLAFRFQTSNKFSVRMYTKRVYRMKILANTLLQIMFNLNSNYQN